MKDSGKAVRAALLFIALFGLFPLFDHIATLSKKTPLYSSMSRASGRYFANRNESVKVADPIRILIPTAEIESIIEYRGIAHDGTMDMPNKPDIVGWFGLGVRPGEIGSAVMAGHYGWTTKNVAVFDNLHKVQVGDKIYVEDKNGAVISFIVREIKLYQPEADAKEVFISNDGKSHLNLITCDGFWSKLTKNYSRRRVVFADRE